MYRTVFLLFVVALISCSDNSPALSQKTYFKFSYVFIEGDSAKAMGVAEFSKEEKDGPKIILRDNVKVLLDTSLLKLHAGIYPQYVCTQDTSNFSKPHTWIVQLAKGTQKEYPFTAKPLSISTPIPSIVGKEDLIIYCDGISETDHVTMLLNGSFSDSSETRLDITPAKGKFVIPAVFWKKVDTIDCGAWFIIWTKREILANDFFKGGEIQTSRMTKAYEIKVVR